MALTFQYNKTSLQQLQKQLRVRQRALPTLKNKESALRAEAKKAKAEASRLAERLAGRLAEQAHMVKLWEEFPDQLLAVRHIHTGERKIAGVRVPWLESVEFDSQPFSWFNAPSWWHDGLEILQELATLSIEREVWMRTAQLLDHARKKTTQKVNLYEKVQIPGYEEAIRRIKRFLEDEDNLAKAAQKLVKARQEKEAQTA